MAQPQPVLIAGKWRAAQSQGVFSAENPRSQSPLDEVYPISGWQDCDDALAAAVAAAARLAALGPEPRAKFLERFAERIEARAAELVEIAALETALPASPRLANVELPRTTDQLRQAAAAVREGTWAAATIDTRLNIRSQLAPLGVVAVFGPNNFPFAFNSIAGGDFAAALAAGNAVIGKANTSHPGVSRRLGEEAAKATEETGLPPGAIQLLYRTSHKDGARFVADPRLGATAYTGSRTAGLVLKRAADAAGKPIYLELSSINPVIVLPGALEERSDKVAEEFATSCLMGTGQFCTNPGLVLLLAGPATDAFIANVAARFRAAPSGTLLATRVADSLAGSVDEIRAAGAELVVGGARNQAGGASYANTLLRASAKQFLEKPAALQTEAFGNESLFVVADDAEQLAKVIESLEGNLTGTIYSHTGEADEALYRRLGPLLRERVGRLLNDRMPTGVAVSAAMNHGGPYPATGHPGFTAVGIPAALRRFARLDCYDQVRASRLPPLLRDENPGGRAWRYVDGAYTRENVSPRAI